MSTVAEIVLDNQGCPYVNWYETGKDFYDHYPVGTKFCAKEPSLEESIVELEQENRLLRARNDRLEAESQKLRENSCRFPLCQTEEYQQNLAEQIKRELYTGSQPSQEQIVAGARALSIRTAKICSTDEGDQWKYYSEELIEDARVVLTAAFNLKG
jgi:hypothetical protein